MSRVVRWNPIREMMAMQDTMERIFEDTWRSVQPTIAGNMLSLDVHETDDAYLVVTSFPGMTADDIHISLHDGILTISGELPQPDVAEDTRVVIQERAYGKFTRNIRLPQAVDVENVEAVYNNGLLKLTLPKTPEAQPRLIPIKDTKLIQSEN